MNASRMRCSTNHAVFCETSRSLCSFMLEMPFEVRAHQINWPPPTSQNPTSQFANTVSVRAENRLATRPATKPLRPVHRTIQHITTTTIRATHPTGPPLLDEPRLPSRIITKHLEQPRQRQPHTINPTRRPTSHTHTPPTPYDTPPTPPPTHQAPSDIIPKISLSCMKKRKQSGLRADSSPQEEITI